MAKTNDIKEDESVSQVEELKAELEKLGKENAELKKALSETQGKEKVKIKKPNPKVLTSAQITVR